MPAGNHAREPAVGMGMIPSPRPATFGPSPGRVHHLVPALLLLPAIGWAQQPPPAPPPAARPTCASPDHRAFDFWVGEWDVTVGGQPAGTNRITLEESGCIVQEHWVGRGGGTGQSFNFFDRRTGEWNQVWVDNAGNVLRLTGRFVAGRLVYGSRIPGPGGTTVEHRLVFSPNPDGTVRQLWETSTDGGVTWTVAFDGMYRRKRDG